jgi:D-alanyl-D-alanine endopeptidase (penicillin-binding protein 7)
MNTGEVILDKNSDETASIASLTKLMTAFVILESDLDLSETITITKADINATKGGGRSLGLFEGAQYTREEVLLISLMSSSNRGAAALARTHPAGFDGFVKLMNEAAWELGMYNTHFTDPTGLKNTNISSPEDLAKLLTVVRDMPTIGRFSTELYYKTEHAITTSELKRVWNKKRGRYVKTYVDNTRTIKRVYSTTNRLLLTDEWEILLQKTGFTKDAGYCVMMIVNINGDDYAFIILHASSGQKRALDATKAKYWVEYRSVSPREQVRMLTSED